MTTNSRIEKFSNCKHQRVQQYTEICLDCGENIYTTISDITIEEQRKERAKTERENFDKDNTGW